VNSNPFSTRFIRPGALSFLFAEGESALTLVEKLRGHHWRGQIVGPHGSGKSTLLAALLPALDAAGRKVISLSLHQGQRRLPPLDREALAATTQLVIDGFEQLSWWSRWRVRWLCRRRSAGLLVTAHADLGLPTIYRTQPSEALAQRVVSALLPSAEQEISPADVSRAYTAAAGNLRETLFALYDVYQAKTQRQSEAIPNDEPAPRK
jgi:hypothetical protein